MTGEGVSSEFSQGGSAADADHRDLAAYFAAGASVRGAGAVYARRLDARSVLCGQMSTEQFSDVWGAVNPYEILANDANRHGGDSVYGGEPARHLGASSNVPGFFASNRQETMHGDQGEEAGQ